MLEAKRRTQTKKIITKRLKTLKIKLSNPSECEAVKQPGRLSKRPAFGCKRSQCRLCHPAKYGKTSSW